MADQNHIEIKISIPTWSELTDLLKQQVDHALDDLSVTDTSDSDFFDYEKAVQSAVKLYVDVCAGHNEVQGTGIFKEQLKLVATQEWSTQAVFECTTTQARKYFRAALRQENRAQDPKVDAIRMIDDIGNVINEEEL